MIYGNYWSEDQIVIARVEGMNEIPSAIFNGTEGTPAFIAVVTDYNTGQTTKYIFVEIIPGTEQIEHFLNLDTGRYENTVCAKINLYEGSSIGFDTMKLQAVDSWPLSWFKLKAIPQQNFDAYDAYDRAMAIVG